MRGTGQTPIMRAQKQDIKPLSSPLRNATKTGKNYNSKSQVQIIAIVKFHVASFPFHAPFWFLPFCLVIQLPLTFEC